MKVFISFLQLYLLTLLLAFNISTVKAEEQIFEPSDEISISLLTCQPGKEVYSLYGHTALRFHNKTKGIDLAINYGIFSFQQPFFTLRFIFGLTDYQMGIEPFQNFCMQYAYRERGIYEQILRLTEKEKATIAAAIMHNYQPENRVYRYNYFDNNCTTKARDMIADNLDADINYNHTTSSQTYTYRKLTHLYTENDRWTRFGNDLLLGLPADYPITNRQQQFIPEFLQNDFEKATLKNSENHRLVTQSHWVIPPFDNTANKPEAILPIHVLTILSLLNLMFLFLEIKKKSRFQTYDFITMLLTGIPGIVLFMMIFSQHPTVSLNLQILLFNPLSLIWAYTAIRPSKRKLFIRYTRVWTAFLCLFVIGAYFQQYAEGILLLALSLLIRQSYHIFKDRYPINE